MTKEEILKNCEFHTAFMLFFLSGLPDDVIAPYENKFGYEGLMIWAKDTYPHDFDQLVSKFKAAVRETDLFGLDLVE